METITRTKIVDVLKSEAYGTTVNVKGWVRTRRGSKQVSFIALNDGSTINNVQIVVDVEKLGEEYLKPITTGACISVNGELVKSLGQGQNVEIQATEIQIYGTAVPIRLVPCSASVITWRSLSTSSFMREVSSISIHRLLQLQTVKVPDRCFR